MVECDRVASTVGRRFLVGVVTVRSKISGFFSFAQCGVGGFACGRPIDEGAVSMMSSKSSGLAQKAKTLFLFYLRPRFITMACTRVSLSDTSDRTMGRRRPATCTNRYAQSNVGVPSPGTKAAELLPSPLLSLV